MEGPIIVCGLGQVGYRVASLLLSLGETVSVVTAEARDEWLRAVAERGAAVHLGDARDEALLQTAGLERASALIAATDQDLVNVEITFDAQRLRPGMPVVVRLFDQTLAHEMERAFDIRRAMGMSALAAAPFASAAFGEQVVGSFTLNDQLFVVGLATPERPSPLTALSAAQLARQYRLAAIPHPANAARDRSADEAESTRAGGQLVLVGRVADWERVAPRRHAPARAWTGAPGDAETEASKRVRSPAIRPLWLAFFALNLLILLSVEVFHYRMDLSFSDALYYVVTTVTTVGYGDFTPKTMGLKLFACFLMLLGSATIATMYSIITDLIVTTRLQQLLGRQSTRLRGHVVVVGLGNVGFRIVNELRRAQAKVVGIDVNPDAEFMEALGGRVPVIIGDGRLHTTLQRAGVPHASAVLGVTQDDATNLGVVLAARQMQPEARTVVRLFSAEFARKVQQARAADAALSAPMIAAPSFVAAALYPEVKTAFLLDERLYVVLERTAGEAWHGQTAAALGAAEGLAVLFRRPASGSFQPIGAEEGLDQTDRLLAVAHRPLQAALDV